MSPLLLVLTLLPPANAEDPGWLPLGRSELGPVTERRTHTWRDARVIEGPILGFAAAVAHEDRILVAAARALPDASVELTVRARIGDRWEDLPPLVLTPRADPEEQRFRLSMTTDPADQPILAWLRADGRLAGLARWRDGRWEVEEAPTPTADARDLAVVLLGETARVYLIDQEYETGDKIVYHADGSALGAWARTVTDGRALEITPSVEGRRQVAVTGQWGRVAWSATPVPANPSLDHYLIEAPAGWDWIPVRDDSHSVRVSGSPRGDAYSLEVWPADMGTHYGCEFNRLQVSQRRLFLWDPLGRDPLRVGHSCSLETTVALLPTAQPTLVTSLAGAFYSAGDDLSVLRWTGERWWGLDGEPSPGTALGDPESGVDDLRFEPDGRLVWVESPDGAQRLAGARWSGRAWVQDRPLTVRGSFGVRSGNTHLSVDVGSTWDTFWGAGRVTATLLQAREGLLHTITLPEVSGADASTCGAASGRPCVPAAMAELADGSVLIALHPRSGGVVDELAPQPPDDWQIWRHADGVWTRESTPPIPGEAWDEPWLFGGPEAVLSLDGAFWVRGAAGWAAIPAHDDLDAPDDLLPLGDGRLMAAWVIVEQEPQLRFHLRVAEWTGSRWDEHDAGLPKDARQPYLALSPTGTPYLATVTEDGEVQLHTRSGGQWRGIAGSNAATGVSNSPAYSYDPAVGFLEGKVCVAWAEEADQEPVVNVRCHAE